MYTYINLLIASLKICTELYTLLLLKMLAKTFFNIPYFLIGQCSLHVEWSHIGCIVTGYLYDFSWQIAAICSLKKVAARISELVPLTESRRNFKNDYFSHKRHKNVELTQSNNSTLLALMKLIYSSDPVPLNSKK